MALNSFPARTSAGDRDRMVRGVAGRSDGHDLLDGVCQSLRVHRLGHREIGDRLSWPEV
jgi:hypothetical protein